MKDKIKEVVYIKYQLSDNARGNEVTASFIPNY